MFMLLDLMWKQTDRHEADETAERHDRGKQKKKRKQKLSQLLPLDCLQLCPLLFL